MAQRTEQQRERSRKYFREWYRAHPEEAKKIKLRSYARKIFALSPDEIAELLTTQPERARK